MRLISKIHVQGFRSIRDAVLDDIQPLTTFAGLNNSGKSNVLRALSAFFTGETEPNKPIDVDDDFYRPHLNAKKRKRIRVAVTFTLPHNFAFRHGLERVRELLGGSEFEIAKEWHRNEPWPRYFLNGNERETSWEIEQFLALIHFRYIPNRVLPANAIRGEHKALRDALIRRLGRKKASDPGAFSTFKTASEKMLAPLVKRFGQMCPGEGEVRLATPESWSDLAFAFGYRLAGDGYEIEDFAQGAGIQSLLMFETFYLIDRDYFQKFGWRQAAVWAVEEPESSLHSTLEAQMADFLRRTSREAESRMQVFSTTHSDLVIQYADRVFLVEKRGVESRFLAEQNPRAALDALAKSGVSRWVHPILEHPLDPILFVEGDTDRAFWLQALNVIRPTRSVQVLCLTQLTDGAQSGGADAMRHYLKEHAPAIKVRRQEAPVMAVLDWDAANKESQFRALSPVTDGRLQVLTWPEDQANLKLGKSFRGIERFLPNRLIEMAMKKGALIGTRPDGQYVVGKEDYDAKVKPMLHQILDENNLTAEDLQHCKLFIETVFRNLGVL
jgi:predicted ATPase